MSSRIEVVQCVENDSEALEPSDVEIGVLDVCMMRFDLDIRVEFPGGLLCNLRYTRLSACCSIQKEKILPKLSTS